MTPDRTVATPNEAWEQAEPCWQLSRDLLGGTRAMRKARERYLPRDENESETRYVARLKRAILYGAYRRTVENLGALPFTRPAQPEVPSGTLEDRDPREQALDESCDRQGTSIPMFCRRRLRHLLTGSGALFLVDYPARPEDASLLDQTEQDWRPYFVPISPEQVIGSRHETLPDGTKILTELRIRTYEQPEPGLPEWEQPEPLETIQVWYRDRVEFWQSSDGDDFAIVNVRPNSLGKIPLVYRYWGQCDSGVLQGEFALEGLAELSVEHYQSTADQRAILHTARIPILFGAGMRDTLRGDIGPGKYFETEDPGATLKWVELTGKSIEEGRRDIQDIEARMEALGIELLVKRDQETATSTRQRSRAQTCRLEDMVAIIEDMIQEGYRLAGDWIGQQWNTRWNLHKDFGLDQRQHDDIDYLLKARIAGEISQETYLAELSRRTVVLHLDSQQELERIKREREESMAMLPDSFAPPGPGPGPGDEDEDEDEDDEEEDA